MGLARATLRNTWIPISGPLSVSQSGETPFGKTKIHPQSPQLMSEGPSDCRTWTVRSRTVWPRSWFIIFFFFYFIHLFFQVPEPGFSKATAAGIGGPAEGIGPLALVDLLPWTNYSLRQMHQGPPTPSRPSVWKPAVGGWWGCAAQSRRDRCRASEAEGLAPTAERARPNAGGFVGTWLRRCDDLFAPPRWRRHQGRPGPDGPTAIRRRSMAVSGCALMFQTAILPPKSSLPDGMARG